MNLQVLTNEEVSDIHNTSLRILANVGVVIEHEGYLKLLEDLGARVNWTKKLAKLPSHLVEERIRRTPNSFILGGRTREHDIFFGTGTTYVRSQSGCDHVIDSETGIFRLPTTEDVVKAAILQDALENIDWCGSHIFPSDEPPMSRDVYQLILMLENTLKPVGVQSYSVESFRYQIKAAKTVVGDEKEFRHRPLISVFPAPTSPLQISEYNCGLVLEASREAIPVIPVSAPINGVSSPITLAGAITVIHAEMLSFLVLAQISNLGTPFMYAARPTCIDMRTTQVVWGSPEVGLMAAACVQMARYIGIPVDFQSMSTESKVPDSQAAIEKALNTTLAMLIKPDSIVGAGQLESCRTSSFAQMVIDNEIIALAKRIARGINVNHETIALDLISRLGPGGQFLGEKHTRQYFSKEHIIPDLFDRNAREKWTKEDGKDLAARTKQKVRRILNEHQPQPLDKDVQKKLREIMNDARRAL